MAAYKFNTKKMDKLNDPIRLQWIPPERVWEILDVKNAGVIVDIGAGTGLFCIEFLHFMKNGKVHAYDIAQEMIQWMTENIVDRYPAIKPERMSETQVPLDDGKADIVFMITLHHELEDPVQIVAESFRVLKPGGKICIIDWKKEDMDAGPPTSIRCRPEEIVVQLETAGFTHAHIDNSLSRHFLVIGEKRKAHEN